jgi:hypothetical protein
LRKTTLQTPQSVLRWLLLKRSKKVIQLFIIQAVDLFKGKSARIKSGHLLLSGIAGNTCLFRYPDLVAALDVCPQNLSYFAHAGRCG